MVAFQLEQLDRKNSEVYDCRLSNTKDRPAELDEFALVRFRCSNHRRDLNIYIGNLKLNCFEQDDELFYSLSSADEPYFSQFFLNNFGLVEVQIWDGTLPLDSYFIYIKSTKVTVDEQKIWLEKIQSVFPISNIALDFASMSSVATEFSNSYGFFSYSSFATELHDFLAKQMRNFERTGFLKLKYSSDTNIGSNTHIEQTKPNLWTSSRMLWKQTKVRPHSLVKRNLRAFEPVKYPSNKPRVDYDSDLNRRLLFRLKEAAKLLQNFIYRCRKTDVKDIELRGEFDSRESKSNLIQITQIKLQTSNEIAGQLIYQLETLGVKSSSVEIKDDSRFGELTRNILKLERLLMPLRKLSSVQDSHLAVPSNDILFEYFSYALFVEAIRSLGFVIRDIGEDARSPVPFHMEFVHEIDNIEINVFYDQTIPKLGREEYFHPLVDKNKNLSFKRPDFIFHIRSNGFDTVFVADAKFKKLKKCLKDNFGTKLNSDHIVAKYSSGISQLGDFGRPPFFILGICLAEDTTSPTEYHSGLHDGVRRFCKSSPIIGAGALAVGYDGYQELSAFFSDALDFHKLLEKEMPASEPFNFSKPLPEKKSSFTRQPKIREEYDYSRSWSHTAPTLNERDVAEIKGMLMRGDKPQDIAFYFGVNNGRISEIKNGVKYLEVPPQQQNLPPPGPYPPLRDLI